MIDVSL